MKKLILTSLCVLVALCAGPAEAALDLQSIVVTSYKSYLDGVAEANPWRFEVWVDFADQGTMDNINMTLPDGSTIIPLVLEEGAWEFESIEYSSLLNLQDDFPIGNYTFDFRDGTSSLLNFALDYSGLSKPVKPVDFTYPATDGQTTGISTNPTFEWLGDSGDGDALAIWLYDDTDDDDIYESIPAATSTTSWTPGALLPAHDYNLEISVINFKNPQAGPAFPTMTVNSDQFEYGLWIEYLNEIEFTTVPEPATLLLLGLGGLMLRKKR